MSKHDYNQNTVASISDAITNSKNEVDNAILSIESMAYSWDTEIIQNVVTWFEVQTILELKRQIGSEFEKADVTFDNVIQRIGQVDSNMANRMNDFLGTLLAIKEKADVIQEVSTQPVDIAGGFSSLHSTILLIDEKYNTFNLDKMTDEDKKAYYELLMAKGELTEEDKKKIQGYLDYLQKRFDLDGTITDEERRFVALYEKLHEDEKDKVDKFFNRCSNLDNSFTEEEKYEMKYLMYTSKEPVHTIVVENIGNVEVADFNAKNDGEDGCFYNNEDKKIYLNRYNRSSFRENDFGPYHGVFEEIAHCIDDYMKNGYEKEDNGIEFKNFFSSDSQYRQRLEDAMRNDVQNNLDKVVLKTLVNTLNGYNSGNIFCDVFNDLSTNEGKVYRVLKDYLTRKLNGDSTPIDFKKEKIGSVEEDIIDKFLHRGAYNTAVDVYGYILEVDWGHNWGSGYSKKQAYTEFFSEYIANSITNSEEDRTARELLPETYKIMDEVAYEKAKELKRMELTTN